MSDKEFNDDQYETEEDRQIEAESEKTLRKWQKDITDAEHAKAWLQTPLGIRLIKTLKVNQMSEMRKCVTATDPKAVAAAQYEYKVFCAVETILGSIVMDGAQALEELEARQQN